MQRKLKALRQEIEEIDHHLVRLLRQRAVAALEIGRMKTVTKLPVFNKAREGEVISQILNVPHDPLNPEDLEGLFRNIIRICSEIQRREG